MDWFRMYGEFASDPKVQSMSESMQRRLMMLLCLRCSNTLVTLQDDEIAFALRISDDELAETKTLFLRKGFIDESWEIANWDKRQFVSDSSAARVAKHRAAKKQWGEQPSNVTVTAQNRTYTEQKQNITETTTPPAAEYSPEFELAWNGYPERPGANKKNAYKAWNARLKAGVDFTQMTLGVDRYAYYCSVMKVEPQFIKQPETFFGPSEHYLSDWKPVAASSGSKNQVEDLDTINARNNAEAKRLLFGTPSEVRTINA